MAELGFHAHYTPTTVKAQDTAFSAEIELNHAGFCARHSDVQLRKEKKNMLGMSKGWTTLLKSCPKCDKEFEIQLEKDKLEVDLQKQALEETRRQQQVASTVVRSVSLAAEEVQIEQTWDVFIGHSRRSHAAGSDYPLP